MFTCQFRGEYLQRIEAGLLSDSVSEALSIIRSHLYPDARFAQGPPIVREISQEAAMTYPSMGPGKVGAYLTKTNEIIFVKGLWCVKTPIHESLHAVSSTQELEEARQLFFLFEGLTECLTGYLLYKTYRYTYSNCWKTDSRDSQCRMSYESHCRLWGSFFHFVPMKVIIQLYFEFPPDWKRMCQRFADSVRRSGYRSFRDVLTNVFSTPPITDQDFRKECERVFGKKFTIFSRTPVALDFSSVIE